MARGFEKVIVPLITVLECWKCGDSKEGEEKFILDAVSVAIIAVQVFLCADLFVERSCAACLPLPAIEFPIEIEFSHGLMHFTIPKMKNKERNKNKKGYRGRILGLRIPSLPQKTWRGFELQFIILLGVQFGNREDPWHFETFHSTNR